MQLNDMNSDTPRSRWANDRWFVARNAKIIDPEEFYQEIVVPSGLFEEAYELFPDYNRSQSVDAAEWMLQQLEDGIFKDGDLNWENMKGDIYDKILAGLT